MSQSETLTESEFEDLSPSEQIDTDRSGVLPDMKMALLSANVINEDEFAKINFTIDDFNLPPGRSDTILKHIWTIVEADENLYAANGFHHVNRLSYLVTEKPCPDGVVEGVWYLAEDNDDENELDDNDPDDSEENDGGGSSAPPGSGVPIFEPPAEPDFQHDHHEPVYDKDIPGPDTEVEPEPEPEPEPPKPKPMM